MSILKTAVISVILSYLPIDDSNIKMQLGMIMSELTQDGYFQWLRNKLSMCKKREVVIKEFNRDGETSPIFEKLQEYLSSRFVSSFDSCELVPKYGDIDFAIKDSFNKKITDTFEHNLIEHVLELRMEELPAGSGRQIVVQSKTATSIIIKLYTQKILNTQIKPSGVISIYRPVEHGRKKDDKNIDWDHVSVKTNKTLQNTVYSEEIIKDLFDDIDYFVKNEEYYKKTGICYKRGYFLYSTPGQGKTSVAKIIASKYNMPIFCLDLTTIDTNATLIKLMTDLNYYTNNEKYLLLMEDADRSDFFKYPHGGGSPLSLDCLLNVLDGVVEPHGRIMIMTANNPECILENTALVRPGRVDKIIELLPCNKYQLQKMYEMFYHGYESKSTAVNTAVNINTVTNTNTNTTSTKSNASTNTTTSTDSSISTITTNNTTDYKVVWDDWEIKEKLSAAYIIKLLQENQTRPDIFLHLSCENKNGTNELEDDDEFKRAAVLAEEGLDDGDSAFMRKINRKIRAKTLKGRIKNAKQKLKWAETRKKNTEKAIEKAQSKIPKLIEQLKEKEEKAKIKKLKEKAQRRKEYLKIKEAEDEREDNINDYYEEEYETPAFLMNTVEKSDVDDDVITTYETMDDDNGDFKSIKSTTKLTANDKNMNTDNRYISDNKSTSDNKSDATTGSVNATNTTTLRKRKNAKSDTKQPTKQNTKKSTKNKASSQNDKEFKKMERMMKKLEDEDEGKDEDEEDDIDLMQTIFERSLR